MLQEYYSKIPTKFQELTMDHIGAYTVLRRSQSLLSKDKSLIEEQLAGLQGIIGKIDINNKQSIRAASEKAQEFRQQMEHLMGLTGINDHAEHYGLYKEMYRRDAEKLPARLKTEDNYAVLLGALTVSTAEAFISTVREISPAVTPIVIDIEGYYVPDYVQNHTHGKFIFADAGSLPFPDHSIAIVHSNYLLSDIAARDPQGNGKVQAVLAEVHRVIAPGGAVTLIE